MDSRFNICTFALFLLLASFVRADQTILDINKYGGNPNGDITQALINAWKEACASTTPSKIVIPKGTFRMKEIELKGPCKAPIEIQVDGIVEAPQMPDKLNGAYQWIKFKSIDFFTLSGSGTFDGLGLTAWKLNDCGKNKECTRHANNFGFNSITNSIIKGITTKDSKNFQVNVLGCNNITFDHFTIVAPDESLNTDGIHIGRSNKVTIVNSNIGTGDDCVSLSGGSKQITIENVTCGPGHGISVGSLGRYPNEEPVIGLYVKNCTMKNTDNGLRIKSWPNGPTATTVIDIHYEDITMINVKNPIIIDQEYCPYNQCSKQNPSKVKISNVTFTNIRGTSATQEGVSLFCSSGVPCEGVELIDVDLTFNGAPATAKCDNVKPIIKGKSPKCAA